jgi:hypothetical protein
MIRRAASINACRVRAFRRSRRGALAAAVASLSLMSARVSRLMSTSILKTDAVGPWRRVERRAGDSRVARTLLAVGAASRRKAVQELRGPALRRSRRAALDPGHRADGSRSPAQRQPAGLVHDHAAEHLSECPNRVLRRSVTRKYAVDKSGLKRAADVDISTRIRRTTTGQHTVFHPGSVGVRGSSPLSSTGKPQVRLAWSDSAGLRIC